MEALDSTPVHLPLMQEQIVFVPLCFYTPLSHHQVTSGGLFFFFVIELLSKKRGAAKGRLRQKDLFT